MATPQHNTSALLIGTGEFAAAIGATTLAQAAALGYRDIGNVTAFDITPAGEEKKHFGSYRGVLRKDDQRKRKIEVGYKLTADEFNVEMLKFALYGANNGDNARSALAAVTGGVLAFSSGSPSGTILWFPVLDASGNHVSNLTALTITSKVEGTDFEVDYAQGMIRFLVSQTASVTPTISAPSIAAGGALYMKRIQPLQQSQVNAIGRLVCYDENPVNPVVFKHTNFSCQISIDGNPSIKGDDYSSLGLMVSIGQLVGDVYSREF